MADDRDAIPPGAEEERADAMPEREPTTASRRPLHRRRRVVAWALYDCGNSAFATSVLAGFFPLFFNREWSVDASGAATTTRLMTVNGIASLLLAVCGPLLGAIADRGGWSTVFLAAFAIVGAGATAGLFFVPGGAWLTAALVFGAASFGFAAANIFYNGMLVDVAGEDEFDRVSAFGFALGYIGGGLLLAVHLAMVVRPEWFLLADTESAVRVAFLTVAVWWVVFTVPLLVALRGQLAGEKPRISAAAAAGLAQLLDTFRRVRRLRHVAVFLVAYWLYIDGVNTVIKFAIDFGYKLGIGRTHLLVALLVVQLISFPAALFFGWLGDRIGAKRGLLIGIGVYVAVTSWAAFLETVGEFYALACAIGLVQGGVASLSRSYYARLIPPAQSAEFFGFYNMIGKSAAVLGPLLVAATAAATGSTRSAVVAILPLFVLGALLLACAPRSAPDSGS